MKILHPDASHLSALEELWEEAFGERDTYFDDFFAKHFKPQNSLIALEGDEVLAMLHTVKTAVQGMPARYLYAVATKRAFRGRGIFTALHQALSAECGQEVFFLIPEEESLRGFYHRFGYEDAFTRPVLRAARGEELCAKEAYALYEKYADTLCVVMTKDEFFTVASDKRFYKGSADHPFYVELRDGSLTSFWTDECAERLPTAMALCRGGVKLENATLPCFLN